MNNCIEVKQGCKMTDKELRKLKKSELLELLLEQNKEVEQLRSQLNKEDDDSLQQSEAFARQLQKELERKDYHRKYIRKLRSTISILIVVAAIAILIATSGQWVDINEAGDVTIDGNKLDEPYVKQKALGHCDIKLPYQVPEGKVFVMGDHRSVFVDSRKSSVGCVGKDQIVGKLVFRVWPLKKLGPVH